MKIPGFKRFQSQDFNKKYSDITDGLFAVLNPFMEVLTQALNKRLNYSDNFDCLDITLDITAPIDPVNGLKVKNTQGGTMRGAEVLYCINKATPGDALTGAPFVQFTTATDGQILITNITGLTSGKTYTIRIVFQR